MSTTTIASGSFFVAGGTLALQAPSYVVRRADEDLLESLRAGEFCYVLNTRQIGKSSLMVRAAARLRDEGHWTAVLDLAALGHNLSPEQWYRGLLTLLGEQMARRATRTTGLEDALDDHWAEHRALGPLHRFFDALHSQLLSRLPEGRRLILFVDEIDAVRSLPFSADEFFSGIRECHNRRAHDPAYERLCFCLLGVAAPADLITDMRVSPFNIGGVSRSTISRPARPPRWRGICRAGKPRWHGCCSGRGVTPT